MVQRLALALALLIVLVAPAAAHAAFPGSNGRVAFARSESSGPVQLFSVDAAGGGLTPLTSDSSHNYFEPAWSPDGRRIAFIQNNSGVPYTLIVANADGSGAHPVASDSSGFIGEPSWAPDGRHLLYAASHPSPGLYVLDVDAGGSPVAIPGSVNYFEGSWSPLGNKIAVSYGADSGPRGVATINTDGSGFQSLDVGDPKQDRDPAWSPDGSRIYFDRTIPAAGCGSEGQIYFVPAGGGAVATFSQDPSISEYYPRPSPDGRFVSFTRCDDPDHFLDHVWMANADGSSPHAFTSGSSFYDEDGDWQPTPPQFASPPTISGSAVDNHELNATAGSSPGGGSTSLQFERCDAKGANCLPIPGTLVTRVHRAVSSTGYYLSSFDIGHAIRVRQTQTNRLGTASIESAPTAAVVPSSGHCSNLFSVTSKRHRVVRGSSGSDRIFGTAGRDRLFGLAGADCIRGGPGNDFLSGGAGNDSLAGGTGNDRIIAGPGRNRVSAGSGNDTINVRNHRRDRVNCGKGHDRVVADKIDKLKGCEIVRRSGH